MKDKHLVCLQQQHDHADPHDRSHSQLNQNIIIRVVFFVPNKNTEKIRKYIWFVVEIRLSYDIH